MSLAGLLSVIADDPQLQRALDSATVGPGLPPVAGEPATGGVAGFGNAATASPATAGKYGLFPQTFIQGTVIVLDPVPANGLYAAIGAGNLRAYMQGQDDRGGAALAN